MTIEKVKIEDIKKNPNNPRTIKDESFKKLVKSIQEFPQMLEIRPIVVDDNMIVLGGNMRLKACKEAGLKEIPIIKASDLTDEQKSEFIIKDNVGYGDWDFDMLNSEWDTELLADWGLNVPVVYEQPDENVEIEKVYQIIIDFKSEEELEFNFNELTNLGYKCKIIQI